MTNELTPEQREILDQLKGGSGTGEKEPQSVTTAFLVVQHDNGQWSAHADWEELDIVASRKAHMDDFVSGAANIQTSVAVQQSAMHTLIAMNQQAQAMQQQVEAQQIARSLKI